MKICRSILLLLLVSTSLVSTAQTEVFLGPGIGTNRNKKVVESDTRKYNLVPFNQDFKIDLGVFMKPHFYLNAAFNVYRQDIRYSSAMITYPPDGAPNSSYVHNHYNYLAYYKYHGFMLVPCFVTGNKVKFFAGAGVNLDFSRIEGNLVRVSEDHYLLDSAGNYNFDYNNTYDSTNQFVQRRGSDFSGIVQSGVIFTLGKSMLLQLNAYFRRSIVLESLEAKNDYKSNAGLSVSIMYRLWGNTPVKKDPDPVE